MSKKWKPRGPLIRDVKNGDAIVYALPDGRLIHVRYEIRNGVVQTRSYAPVGVEILHKRGKR